MTRMLTLKNISVLLAFLIGCFFIHVGIEQTQYIALSTGERDYASGFINLFIAFFTAAIIGSAFVKAFRYLKIKESYAVYISEVVFILVSAAYAFLMLMA